MQRARTPIFQEQNHAQQRGEEPKQHINQINPDGIFHSLKGPVAARVSVDEEFSKDTEDGGPEDTVFIYRN